MQLAQTDPDKLAKAQAPQADEESPRRGRDRPARSAVAETPLVQVETRGETPGSEPKAS
jgi:hypothetical protein